MLRAGRGRIAITLALCCADESTETQMPADDPNFIGTLGGPDNTAMHDTAATPPRLVSVEKQAALSHKFTKIIPLLYRSRDMYNYYTAYIIIMYDVMFTPDCMM